MKRFLFLLLGLGALCGAQAQTTGKSRVDQLLVKRGDPGTARGEIVGGVIYDRWYRATNGKLYARDPFGVDSLLTGGGAMDLSQYIRNGADGAIRNLNVTSSLNYKNPGGYLPPELSDSDPGWVQAYSGNPATKGDGRRIDAAKIGLRAVSAAPIHSTDPGKHGDFFVDKAASKKFEYLRNFDGTAQWGRIDGYVTNFDLPSGLPAAPTLTANLSGAQSYLSWSVAALATEYELHRSIGANAWGILPTDNPAALTYPDNLSGLPAGTKVYYRVRGVNSRGTGPFSPAVEVTIPSAPVVVTTPTRQLLYNIPFEGNLRTWIAGNLLGKPITGVNFLLRWVELQGTDKAYKFDTLLSALQYVKDLGWKAEVNVLMVRKRYNDATPQDYSAYWPDADCIRYQDGSLYLWEGNWVVNHAHVAPSPSSAVAMTAARTFWAALAAAVKPYHDDGTLISLQPALGNGGEFNYAYNPFSGHYSDFSAAALTNWRGWLEAKYGTVAALNSAWGTAHASFSAVGWVTPLDTGPAHFFDINSNPRRDWMRWRLGRWKFFLDEMRAGVKSAAPNIPFVGYFADVGVNFQFIIGLGTANVAYLLRDMDGLYSSAGDYPHQFPNHKLLIGDLVPGTFGPGKYSAIEVDPQDVSLLPSPWNYENASDIYSQYKKFYDKGGWVIHISPVAGWNWAATSTYLQQLKTEYCTAPNNAVTPRAPVASVTYNYSTMLGPDPSAHFTAWNSVSGPTQQVNLRQVDDFTGVAVEAPTVPVPPVLLPVAYETTGGGVTRVEWTHTGTGVSYFELQRKVGSGAFGPSQQLPAAARVIKPAVTEAAGSVITFRVRAVNSTAGASGWSSEQSVTVPSGATERLNITLLNAWPDSARIRVDYAGTRTPVVARLRKWTNTSPPGPDTVHFNLNNGYLLEYNVPSMRVVGAPLGPFGAVTGTDYGVVLSAVGTGWVGTYMATVKFSGGDSLNSSLLTVNALYGGTSGDVSILTRAQPNSAALAPTAELDGADNETPNLNLARLPKFTFPTGLTSEWFIGGVGAQNALSVLDYGITHTDEHGLLSGGLNASGKANIGANVPFTRRARMMGNNVLQQTEAGARYVGATTGGLGYPPRNADEEADIRLSVLNDAIGGLHFNDITAAGRFWVNLEARAHTEAGVNAQTWENVKRDQMLNPLKQYRGTGNIPASHKVGFQGASHNSAWGAGQDFFAETGYHKTRFAYGPGFSKPHDFWDFYQVLWERQGAWAHHSVQNVEYARATMPQPVVPLNAPYHEDGMGDTDRDGLWKFYKLRPDVAENWAPLAYLSGAKGTGLWNAPRVAEWKNSEERYLRGLWRIAQHPDIFDGDGQQYVTPEFSLDGGATWRRTKQGNEWGGFKYSMMDGYVPYQAGPPYNPSLSIPAVADRLIVKAVVKNGKILVGAIDPWNYQGTTLDIRVRYAGLNDQIRLYGRNLYLGKTTL
jgi:hypothetical protein